MNNGFDKEKLKSFVERVEVLIAQRKDINDNLRDLRTEAKSFGYGHKIIGKIIKIRYESPDDYLQEEHITEMYLAALATTPLERYIKQQATKN